MLSLTLKRRNVPSERAMQPSQVRRRILGAAMCSLFAGCGGSDSDASDSKLDPVPDAHVNAAISQLDALAAKLMATSGIPGMAVAVVRGTQTIYAKGFGVRLARSAQAVDAETVFQLASVSKSLAATVVARQISVGGVGWDTTLRAHLPWFALSDPAVSDEVTIGDMFSHQSGLPDHAGDRLEAMGYDRRQVLERLRYLPLAQYRHSYAYTNFGLTAGAESVAVAAGIDWATLSEQVLYKSLGMNSTSSRYADFIARPNRAIGHVRQGDAWVQSVGRMPDAQSPAGGVSASASDVAKWLSLMLSNGAPLMSPAPLVAATTAQVQITPGGNGEAPSYYGFGFNVGTTAAGRPSYNHSGAFSLGAATHFLVVPSTGLAIVVLTNTSPIGVPETLALQFFDLIQFGSLQRDWYPLLNQYFLSQSKPSGSLVGKPRPTNPLPARALSTYTGTYNNDYYGPIQVVEQNGALAIIIGPAPLNLALTHWDGDVFIFTLVDENAEPGTISKASFSSNQVILEYYDEEGLGTFAR
jgi:CubicO group peptidase (beta-lactamase class C family)